MLSCELDGSRMQIPHAESEKCEGCIDPDNSATVKEPYNHQVLYEHRARRPTKRR